MIITMLIRTHGFNTENTKMDHEGHRERMKWGRSVSFVPILSEAMALVSLW